MREIIMLTSVGEKTVGKVYSVSNNEAWALVEEKGYAQYMPSVDKSKELKPKKKVTREMVSAKPKGYKTK